MSYYYDDSYENDYEQYEEECEWYGKYISSWNNSYYLTLRDDRKSCEKIYEEYPFMFSLADDQLYSGKNPKEPLEYFLDYCALNDECLKTIYFRSYCSVAIGFLFLNPLEEV